jgi:hypothetical protein
MEVMASRETLKAVFLSKMESSFCIWGKEYRTPWIPKSMNV